MLHFKCCCSCDTRYAESVLEQVNKRKGEEYQLFWPEDPDFVRLAAKLNALIIPFAAVGGDEAFDLALDSDEVLSHPIFGGLARSALSRIEPGLPLSEAVPPVTKLPGLGLPSLLPVANLSRLYFRSASYHPSYLFTVQDASYGFHVNDVS